MSEEVKKSKTTKKDAPSVSESTVQATSDTQAESSSDVEIGGSLLEAGEISMEPGALNIIGGDGEDEFHPPMHDVSLREIIADFREVLMKRAEEINTANTKDGSKAGVNLHGTRLMMQARVLDGALVMFDNFLAKEGLE